MSDSHKSQPDWKSKSKQQICTPREINEHHYIKMRTAEYTYNMYKL